MARFTPYMPADLTSLTRESVKWQLTSHRGEVREEPSIISSAGYSEQPEYELSMITCEHPEGKVWESMFIPTTVSGAEGISITWWAKNSSGRGQAQIKLVGESEWYSTVKSKAVSKGYKVTNFIGREVPVGSGHTFVLDLHKDELIPSIFSLGMTRQQSIALRNKGGNELIGLTIGTAISNIVPTDHFVRKMAANGHSVVGMIDSVLNSTTIEQKDILKGITNVEGLRNVLAYEAPKGARVEPVKSREQVNAEREETYGAWGAFG